MQGFNMGRYIPPDLEGTSTTFNAASGKGHALGSRARKLKSEGILTVRFECPFPLWCTNCQPEHIIGQGVRFNAEKKKVGNYYSTPIWSFRFKHTVCGGWIEVRTDPKNTEYVVVDGGRRRDEGREKVLEGEIEVGVSEEEKARLERDGAFGAVEKKVVDKQVLVGQGKRLEELEEKSRRYWEDPYERSRALRREFRVGRKVQKEGHERGERLQEKFSLGVEMVEEREEDALRAGMVEFGKTEDGRRRKQGLFEQELIHESSQINDARGKKKKQPSAPDLMAEKKASLAHQLRENTRAVIDPFLASYNTSSWQSSLKRKRPENQVSDIGPSASSLVEYDSDSPYHPFHLLIIVEWSYSLRADPSRLLVCWY
jgi:coiled-coil domain-containing protein 130